MKLATWNVNSIRAREERLLNWLQRWQPDVLCLQELKVDDASFPYERLREAGYCAAVNAQKTYNGVAILTKEPCDAVQCNFCDETDDPQARLIAAKVADVQVACVYVPNGQTPSSEKYQYKLLWIKRLRAWLERHFSPDQPLVICGDFNIAPQDIDAAFPEQWRESVLFNDEMRQTLRQEVLSWGLVDLFREKNPDVQAYSWWDYRMLGFPKGDGLRIDLILGTPPMLHRCTSVEIDRNERKGKLPSDHAPVIAHFD